MSDSSIHELNSVLKGEYMAISKYDHYIQHINDQNIKTELQKIQQNHKQQAQQVSNRIQQLGGDPVDGAGLQGKITETITKIKEIGKNTNSTVILKEAVEGENIGINMTNKYISTGIDNDSMNIINNIVNENKNIINTLNNLINTSNSSGMQ